MVEYEALATGKDGPLQVERPRLVLASASPRRKVLLEKLGIPFEVAPANVAEDDVSPGDPPEVRVERLALVKAQAVHRARPEAVVIGADTLVEVDGRVLGKPRDEAEAATMLRLLSGREHSVHTGLALVGPGGRSQAAHESTRVRFRPLDDREIVAYVATGSPMDKAGAYGIQDQAATFVSRVEGCFFSVMGLPLARLVEELRRFGVTWP
ncbi:Maf family protein [Limnochorda pilosa]|uniref:dTTP/UTP pyrophosphatase n=1 Tax=Limnochorda pilosa TaxID=1555112 RepID=A0A0K2SND6_LIMPI|nr:Maf family protein [Limnochorda pilosa]BAS28621.1 septum formation protein Maf [Limnochorda pilosa]